MKRIAAVVFLLFVGCNFSPGDGEKIGQIIKVSRTGMIRDTWECQLIRGGMTSGSGTVGVTPFDFTIHDGDTKLIEAAKMALESQQEVIIKYDTAFWFGCSSDTGHFARSIEVKK